MQARIGIAQDLELGHGLGLERVAARVPLGVWKRRNAGNVEQAQRPPP
jgi:hypothetical protein